MLIHPCAIASGFPWRSRFRSCARRWRALLGSWGILLEARPELGTPATPARPRNIGRPDAALRLVNGVGVAISRVFGAESPRFSQRDNNVGSVKSFLSALLRSLRRVVFVVFF